MTRRRKVDEARLLFGWVAVLWAIELINSFSGHALDRFGIVPRTLSGLLGVPLAPFLHGSVGHLLVNTVPLVVLGGLLVLGERNRFLPVTVFIGGVGGGLVWLLGRGGAVHIGASGVISGYFGYLLARGVTKRSMQSFLVAVITALLYGGMIIGVLPTNSGVSWESHLFGLLAGVIAAHRR